MSLRHEQQPIQTMGQHMTAQQLLAIKLLQLPRAELEQELTQHLEANPLLEDLTAEGEDEEEREETAADESSQAQDEDGAPDDAATTDDVPESDGDPGPSAGEREEYPAVERIVARRPCLAEHLLWQLEITDLPEAEKAIGRLLIGNLDENGYLEGSLAELAATAGAAPDRIEPVLRLLQTFDPPGVGARDLRECLLIQLDHLDGDRAGTGSAGGRLRGSLVEAVIARHLGDLEARAYTRIAKSLGVTEDEVRQAVHTIERLEPKPGRPFCGNENYSVLPDVLVAKGEGGDWTVSLNDGGLPRIGISAYYRRLMASQKAGGGEAKAYLAERHRAAQWLLRSLAQRYQTILAVARSIVKFQRAFFDQGVRQLRPLTLKQVAEDVHLHEATISRTTAGKYLSCPQGLYELKFFFPSGVPSADRPDEGMAAPAIKDLLRQVVAGEDPARPLTDDEIAARLRGRVVLARRTIAKYRAELRIPPASRRKHRTAGPAAP